MKLRNLMYATMIACAFASCSKDDGVIDNGGATEDTNATLSVKIGSLATKSTGTAYTDSTINSLTVYVYDAAGATMLKSQTTTISAASGELTAIPVKAGSSKVVVVANESPTTSDLSAFYTATKNFVGGNEVNGTLSMNSKTYNVNLIAGKENKLGYNGTDAGDVHYLTAAGTEPVYLFRNVGKVKLASLKVTSSDQYPKASFVVEDVFILHGSVASKLIGGAQAWSETAVPTTDASWLVGTGYRAEYSNWVSIMNAAEAAATAANKPSVKKQNYLTSFTNLAEEGSYVASTDAKKVTVSADVAKANIDSFYVYENPCATTDINTLLVVKGKFLFNGTTTTETASSYYSVAVGNEGVTSGTFTAPAHAEATRSITSGVLRNMQYIISLNIKSPGYETPFGPKLDDKTTLDVQVQVVPFGQVKQDVEI